MLMLNKVSVPLRGKYRGECLFQVLILLVLLVSVPLRGKYRGELSKTNGEPKDSQSCFRPLAG